MCSPVKLLICIKPYINKWFKTECFNSGIESFMSEKILKKLQLIVHSLFSYLKRSLPVYSNNDKSYTLRTFSISHGVIPLSHLSTVDK